MAAPPDPIKPDPSVSAKKWKPTTAQNSGNSSHVSLLTPGQSSPLPAVTPFGAPSSAPSTGAPAAPSPFTKLAPAALFLPISRNAHDERKGHAEMFDFGTKVHTVRIGPEPKHKDFTVHQGLLQQSSYFSKIRQNASSHISLPDQKSTAFNVYVQWLYTKGLYTKPSAPDPAAAGNRQHSSSVEWFTLVDVYLLGYKLEDVAFRDRVMDGILEWLREVKSSDDLTFILDTADEIYSTLGASGKTNPLRRLVSDIVALKFSDAQIQRMTEDHGRQRLPQTFLLDLVSKMSARIQGAKLVSTMSKAPEQREACHYHCHGMAKCYNM